MIYIDKYPPPTASKINKIFDRRTYRSSAVFLFLCHRNNIKIKKIKIFLKT